MKIAEVDYMSDKNFEFIFIIIKEASIILFTPICRRGTFLKI